MESTNPIRLRSVVNDSGSLQLSMGQAEITIPNDPMLRELVEGGIENIRISTINALAHGDCFVDAGSPPHGANLHGGFYLADLIDAKRFRPGILNTIEASLFAAYAEQNPAQWYRTSQRNHSPILVCNQEDLHHFIQSKKSRWRYVAHLPRIR